MNATITEEDLIELGYGTSYSANIIKQAKEKMVKKGYPFYSSRKLNRVPVDSVEEILGMPLKKSE